MKWNEVKWSEMFIGISKIGNDKFIFHKFIFKAVIIMQKTLIDWIAVVIQQEWNSIHSTWRMTSNDNNIISRISF